MSVIPRGTKKRISLRLALNTLANAGPGFLVNRLYRRMRYQCLYPWAARFLFAPPHLDQSFIPPLPAAIFDEKAAAMSRSRAGLLHEAEELVQRRFTFLNICRPAGDEENASNPFGGADPLWELHFHYGEWALALMHAFLATGEPRFLSALMQMVAWWIKRHPAGSLPGWEPYALSRRLVAWARLAPGLAGQEPFASFWRNVLAPSLDQQTKVLAANLELDLRDNHLLANYRALAWMGLLFPDWPGAERWRQAGLEGLWTEMRRQVLPDGVHDERSISYHTLVLQDLLETAWLAKHRGRGIPGEVAPTLLRMLQFLADGQAPDGTWPMVNDSVPDYPMNPASLLLAGGYLFGIKEWQERGRGGDGAYAAWLGGQASPAAREEARGYKRLAVFPEAGYAVLRGVAQDYLFFDAGPLGPRRLPGHGHADALSFVLHEQGRPLIVDPGVYSYHEQSWRNHFRSTLAHNTVAVDGLDQCLFWGPFRVAYPPEAHLLDWSERHATGEHTGYVRLPDPVVHRRRIDRKTSGEWLIGDRFEGRGTHTFSLSLQFASGALGELSGLNGEVRWPDGVRLRIESPCPLPGASARMEPGWVSPAWHLKEKALRYRLEWRTSIPADMRIALRITP